ncbi:hypothetical protein PR048_033247 [Dryococelus australis]|uniref:DDE Tnp4 domain-containing protein n=1 Tax=Dryococelus australis TaxID=614101 RepID=A0ABQ9G3Z1_9NEOP|nr:hypothetical protein PR048_033247 [Dryococelus australis]
MRPDLLEQCQRDTLDKEQRSFNYCHLRTRLVVGNTFGTLAESFKIFHTYINLQLHNIDSVVLTCYALHNVSCKRSPHTYTPTDSMDREHFEDDFIELGVRGDLDFVHNLELGSTGQIPNSSTSARDTLEFHDLCEEFTTSLPQITHCFLHHYRHKYERSRQLSIWSDTSSDTQHYADRRKGSRSSKISSSAVPPEKGAGRISTKAVLQTPVLKLSPKSMAGRKFTSLSLKHTVPLSSQHTGENSSQLLLSLLDAGLSPIKPLERHLIDASPSISAQVSFLLHDTLSDNSDKDDIIM